MNAIALVSSTPLRTLRRCAWECLATQNPFSTSGWLVGLASWACQHRAGRFGDDSTTRVGVLRVVTTALRLFVVLASGGLETTTVFKRRFHRFLFASALIFVSAEICCGRHLSATRPIEAVPPDDSRIRDDPKL